MLAVSGTTLTQLLLLLLLLLPLPLPLLRRDYHGICSSHHACQVFRVNVMIDGAYPHVSTTSS